MLRWSITLLLVGCFPTPEADGRAPAPLLEGEHAATVAALAPRRAGRPLVVDVVSVSPQGGRVRLLPAMEVEVEASFSDLEDREIDYVLVGALHASSNPELLAWLRSRLARGSHIAGVCSGSLVLANAGLLDGRRATGHWADLDQLIREHPTMTWVRDRRYVVDGQVSTTTGVTASLPFALALVEAIGGTAKARAVAQDVGIERWDEAHDSDAFRPQGEVWAGVGNELWHAGKQLIALPLADGVDELAAAFIVDAYSRTLRSRVTGLTEGSVVTRSGLALISPSGERADVVLPPPRAELPALALDEALEDISTRYGRDTARLVALQLERAWGTQ